MDPTRHAVPSARAAARHARSIASVTARSREDEEGPRHPLSRAVPGALFRGSAPQKSQSSSSVATALPMTYDEPDPLKKSWFSSALGESADRIAGFTLVTLAGNMAS